MIQFIHKRRHKKIALQIKKDLAGCSRILDNGAGNGSFDYAGKNVNATDIRKGVDSHQLPFKDKEFDAVVMAGLINYVVNPAQVMKEGLRVLKKKGLIIVTIFNLKSLWMRYGKTLKEPQNWSISGFRKFLEHFDLSIQKEVNFGLVYYFLCKKK